MTDAVTAPADAPRRYRFGPLDRAGVLLGLSTTQCVLLGGGILTAGLVLQTDGSVAVALAPVLVAGLAAFGRWRGRAIPEWLGAITGWASATVDRRRRWRTPIPQRSRARRPSLPEFLAGLALREVSASAGPRVDGIGIVHDRGGRVSATLRVQGREFALLQANDQGRVLDAWGSALGSFARERSPVTRLSWCEWSAPASLDEHLAFVHAHPHTDRAQPLLDAYVEMVTDTGPLTTTHDVLLTVTVDGSRLDTRHSPRDRDPAVALLLDELALLTRRLDHAGLDVQGPLSAAQLAEIIRLRLDPSCAERLRTRAATLAEAAGVVSAHNWAPIAVELDWHHVRVDGSWHRCYWIAEWPRLEVPADWMAPLVLHAGTVRTLTLVYEPIAPSRSRRAVDRDATRLASDEDQRSRRGFRIGASHRRAEHEVLAREAELVAGYPEFAYTGFLTVTAATREDLDAGSADWEQAAAQVGIELRCLDGQHDLALAAAVPIGRGPTPRRHAG